MVEDTGEHQMEEMHGSGYVEMGLEFPCFLWVLHSPSISPRSAFWKLYEHFTLGIFMETSKFGVGVQDEAGQRLTEFCQENALVIANTLFQQQREDSTHGHHKMVDTEIRLIIFFAAKDVEAL